MSGSKTGFLTGLVGSSDSYSQQGLLELALKLACSGTLAVRYRAGTRLLLLDKGKIKSSFEVGTPGEPDESGIDYHFEPHHVAQGIADLPQLSSPYPATVLGVMKAVPVFGPAQPLSPGLVDLRALANRASEQRLTAALTVAVENEHGVALFHEGRIGAAFFERGGHVWERSDALRAIYRYSLESSRPAMQLHHLDEQLMRSLLGLALERRAGAGDPNSFTGLTAGEGGYTFYCDGRAYLHQSARLGGTSGRFTPLETVPDLELPDDPPGWESRRFDLTLRGRDALNPMTELSMSFGDNYGPSGRRVLEAVRRGLSIEDAAARLDLDLQALKPWLERLEADGLIRPRP